jgi:hypothetical protein
LVLVGQTTLDSSKMPALDFRSSNSGTEKWMLRKPIPGLLKVIFTKRLGSSYGKERNSTAFTMLKIDVFAPIPNASVRMIIRVKPGLFRMMRKAYRISLNSISMISFLQ